ncbi:MAG: hypothetical protein ACFCUW_15170 [Kiloniellaceae bacterium]
MSDDRRDRLEELWQSYVYDGESQGNMPTDRLQRVHDALDRLAACRVVAERAGADGDDDTALSACSKAITIWRLVTEDTMGWAAQMLLDRLGASEEGTEQVELLWMVEAAHHAPPTHRTGFSFVAPVVPVRLAEQLKAGLRALRQGEVRPIFEPVPTKRDGGAWSHDQARLRAIQHVAYLHRGERGRKRAAREEVAVALQVVPGETLRNWECRELPRLLGEDAVGRAVSAAEGAGRIHRQIEENPHYGCNDGVVFDAVELALYDDLQRESLADFAERFRRAFGGRHWSPRQL